MPSRSEDSETSSRRSRSRRSRSRHRRHRSTTSRARAKNGYKNFPAAFCNMLAIVLLCTSLAEPKWISLTGGGCMVDGKPLHHLGIYQFFYPGKFLSQERDFSDNSIIHVTYKYGPDASDKMDNCVTYKAALLMRTVIAFCFLAIITSLTGFVIELFGPTKKPSRLLQQHAIPSIVTVILSVVINLFCYWLTTEVEDLQINTKLRPGSKVIVDFDISFYLVTAAGGLSVLGTAFTACYNCMNLAYEDRRQQVESLLDDYDGMHVLPPHTDAAIAPQTSTDNLPAPPAYTP